MPRKSATKPRVTLLTGDIGPTMLAPDGRRMVPIMSRHAEVLVIEDRAGGRRSRRNPMHERLERAGRIDARQYNAVEQFICDHEFLSRCGMSSALASSGGGFGSLGPSADLLVASTRYRLAVQRVGAWRVCYLIDACCEAMTGRAMARKYLKADGGDERAEVEARVLEAIGLLVGRRA